jgi:hypothetical protein
MPSKKLDQDLFFSPPGTHLYNIHFKSGVLSTRVTVRGFEGLRLEHTDWVWIVDERRRATPDEIRKLCKASTHKGR